MFLIMISPIVVSVAVLIYALRKGFNKTALVISAAVAMVSEMLVVRYISDSWYAFLFSLTVPLAVTYVLICLYLSIKANKESGDDQF
jgi:hypothetical protein